jgi:hypothetical protein
MPLIIMPKSPKMVQSIENEENGKCNRVVYSPTMDARPIAMIAAETKKHRTPVVA